MLQSLAPILLLFTLVFSPPTELGLPDGEAADLTTPAPRVVAGWVVDTTGSPVEGAMVRARSAGETTEGPSDADGRFELLGLSPGALSLDVSAVGCRPYRLADLGSAGVAGDGLWITLQPAHRVSGTVLDPEGFPVPDARVELFDPEGGYAAGERSTTTDDEGRFDLTDLSPGPRKLWLEHPEHPRTEHTVEVGDMMNGTANDTANDTANELELAFDAGVGITGRVVDSLGLPLEGVRLRASRADGQPGTVRDRSDDEGTFLLAPLAAGRYHVQAELPGRADASQIVDIGPDELPDIELRLPAGATLRGQVRGLGDTPAGRIRVRASGVGPLRSAGLDPGGVFRLEHLPAGEWMVRVAVAGRLARKTVTLEPWMVEQGAEVEVDLDLGAGWVVSGSIRRQGEPLAGARIFLASRRGWDQQNTEEDGSFRFEGLEEGTYQLSVRDFADGLQHHRSFVVTGDEHLDLDLAPTELHAIVRDGATGAPLAGIPIRLSRLTESGEQAGARRFSDSAGRIHFGSLVDGRWQLASLSEAHRPIALEVVPSGRPVDEVELWLDPR